MGKRTNSKNKNCATIASTSEPQLSEGDVSKTSLGDSVLMEKVNKNVEALLKAFDARIKPDTILPKQLKEYPNPMEEKRRLAKYS